MRALVKSLLAELFPGWVKEEVIQRRSRVYPHRRVAAAQNPSTRKNPSFGKRSSYQADASGQRKGRDASGPGARA